MTLHVCVCVCMHECIVRKCMHVRAYMCVRMYIHSVVEKYIVFDRCRLMRGKSKHYQSWGVIHGCLINLV